MASQTSVGERRVGPPSVLGLISRFMQRAHLAASEDERIRALSLWGSLARGDGDEWSSVEYVATVADESVSEVVHDLAG